MLIFKRPWEFQPQNVVGLDFANPGCSGLVGAWAPTQGPANLAGQSALFKPTVVTPSIGGLSGRFANILSTETQLLTSDWSFIVAFTTGIGGSPTLAVLGRGPTTLIENTGFGFHAVHATPAYAGAIYTGSSYSIIGKPTGGALADNTRYVIGAGRAGTNGAVYNAGVRTGTASGLSTTNVTGRLVFGSDSAFVGIWSTPPSFEVLLVWNRMLNDSEFMELSNKPWQLFARSEIRIPYSDAAPGVFKAAWARQRGQFIGAGMR